MLERIEKRSDKFGSYSGARSVGLKVGWLGTRPRGRYDPIG